MQESVESNAAVANGRSGGGEDPGESSAVEEPIVNGYPAPSSARQSRRKEKGG